MKRVILLLFVYSVTAGAQAPTETTAKAILRDISVPEAVAALKADQDVIIIDVRSAKEFKAGHLRNATHIGIKDKDFQTRLEKLDRNKSYLVYCHSGYRSGKTMKLLKKLGFTNVMHMKDGYRGWSKQHPSK